MSSRTCLIGNFAAALLACASNQSWRSRPPEPPAAAPAVVAPRVVRLDRGAGPALLHVPRPGPTITLGLALRTGDGVDPALASFALELVARGPDRAVEDALGEHGGAIDVRWLGDGALLLVEVDAARWPAALEILADAVRAPGLTEADVDELRGERLATIQRRDGAPVGRAMHVLVRAQAPEHDALGDARAVSKWSLEHVRKVIEQCTRAAPPALVIVGDAPPAALTRAAARALAGWPGDAERPPSRPRVEPARAVWAVPRPGLAQTAIVVGRRVPGDADALALELASAVAASALREVLRRDRGDTYSVTVTHTPARTGGLLAIETQVDAAATGASLRALLSQLPALQGRFLTGDTLRLLGRAFQIERMLEQQRGVDVAEAVARIHLSGRPDDALTTELRRLGAARDDDVERALATWFERDALHVVLVGDPATLRAQVEPLGLGPLRWLDDV